MKIYRFHSKQQLKLDIEEAWKFFSDPGNLSKITPPALNFKILAAPENNIYAGMMIEYKVSPLLNIPVGWLTEITHSEEPYYFVDEQKKGPYKLWHHEHIFKINKDGVDMYDIVTYALPFGVIGRLAHKLIVRKKVKEIFDYRREILNRLFAVERIQAE